jgi:hypothetical protein
MQISGLVVFVGVIVACLWVLAIVNIGMKSLEADTFRSGFAWCGLALALFAAPFAVAAEVVNSGEPSLPLCARGHEEYVRYRRPPMLVGKVLVPGGHATSRVWVCEERQP